MFALSPLILQERCKADMLTLDMCDKRCCCRCLQRPHGRVGRTSCNWDRPHVHHSDAEAISRAPPAEFIPPTSDASWPGFIRHFIRQQTIRRRARRYKSLISLVGVAGFEPATPSSRTRCATRLGVGVRRHCPYRSGPTAETALMVTMSSRHDAPGDATGISHDSNENPRAVRMVKPDFGSAP